MTQKSHSTNTLRSSDGFNRPAVLALLMLCSVTSAVSAQPPEKREKFHLFLLAGQSNMAGRGSVEAEQEKDGRVFALNKDGEWVVAQDPLHFDKPKVVGVGLGRTFAADYADANPDISVGLIPCAVGGSPIESWIPGGMHEQTKSYPLDDTLKRVAIARKSGVLKGILWHQGESNSNERRSAGYEAKLAQLVDNLRTQFGDPQLPFVIGQLGIFKEKPWNEFRVRVDGAHKRLASTLHKSAFVSSLGLGHKGDITHFNSDGYRELGHRYYQAFMRAKETSPSPRLVSVQRIWDKSQHNAFTDLVRFHDHWYCVFREGSGHVSDGGAIRIIRSDDGNDWESAGLLKNPKADLRDAKITITPDDRLMIAGAGAMHDFDPSNPKNATKHQSFVWTSSDGESWSEGVEVGEKNYWLWRTTWHDGKAYGVGYQTFPSDQRSARLYESSNGLDFEVLVEDWFSEGYPNETSMVFTEQGTCYCLLRMDPFRGSSASAQLGIAEAPYQEWKWKDLGQRIGGPHMVILPDGRVVASVRLYDGHVRTSLCWVDVQQGKLEEFLRLPSGGDTSYPGMVLHDEELWVSYYSQHESYGGKSLDEGKFKTAIYLARVKLP